MNTFALSCCIAAPAAPTQHVFAAAAAAERKSIQVEF